MSLQTLTLEGIAGHLTNCKNVVFMTGAGISVSSGIPDFRSPKTGLYHNLQKYNLPRAESIFELDYFRERPQAFNTLAKELYPGEFKPSIAHCFITLLHERGIWPICLYVGSRARAMYSYKLDLLSFFVIHIYFYMIEAILTLSLFYLRIHIHYIYLMCVRTYVLICGSITWVYIPWGECVEYVVLPNASFYL